ncbi:MAG TPA: hypothetical protein PKA81_14805 [Clostridia bacterium]|nr:hypothetical protein [Clostridia bacterium]
MKRAIAISVMMILLCASCVSCAPAEVATAPIPMLTPGQTATVMAQPTPKTTPEPLGTAPQELFLRGYNLFSDVAFPAGFTVFAARYDTAQPEKGLNDHFALYLTAEGDRAEISRFCAGLLGITDEARLTEIAGTMEREVAQQIDGTFGGAKAYAQLKQTKPGVETDQTTDVEGCRIELSVEVSAAQAQAYQAMIHANNNRAVFGALADRLSDDFIQKDKLSIYVNAQRPELTEVSIAYRVLDAKALEAELAQALKLDWHDEQGANMGVTYGRIRYKLSFDAGSNTVYETLSPNDNTSPAGEYVQTGKSLMAFGFQYDKTLGTYVYDDKKANIRFEVVRAKDGETRPDWSLLFICQPNGYNVGIWYFVDDQQLLLQTDYKDRSAKFYFDLTSGTYLEPWPNDTEIDELFSEAFEGCQGDVRKAAIERMTKEAQDRFGITWQELSGIPLW